MFAALGTKVTLVEKRARLLDFCDAQITEGLQYHLRDLGVVFRLGEEVTAVERHADAALTQPREREEHSGARSSSTPPAARGRRTTSSSKTPVSRPTSAGGSRSGPTTARPSSTSSRPATSSAGRAWRRPRWSRGAWPLLTPSATTTRAHERAASDRHLHDPRDQLRRSDRGGAHRSARPLRGRHLALPRARARPDPRRHLRDAEAARVDRGPDASWASTSSGRTRPRSSTSARR